MPEEYFIVAEMVALNVLSQTDRFAGCVDNVVKAVDVS